MIAFDITKPSTFEDVTSMWLDETKKIEVRMLSHKVEALYKHIAT